MTGGGDAESAMRRRRIGFHSPQSIIPRGKSSTFIFIAMQKLQRSRLAWRGATVDYIE
jgi:hypothetical protein